MRAGFSFVLMTAIFPILLTVPDISKKFIKYVLNLLKKHPWTVLIVNRILFYIKDKSISLWLLPITVLLFGASQNSLIFLTRAVLQIFDNSSHFFSLIILFYIISISIFSKKLLGSFLFSSLLNIYSLWKEDKTKKHLYPTIQSQPAKAFWCISFQSFLFI